MNRIFSDRMGFEVDYGATLFMCIFYFILGIISTLINLLNIFVYSRRPMRNKYLYQLAFEIFELVDSISYILTGIGRGSGLLGGYFTNQISVNDCFFKTYWPQSLILGMEWPCYMVILMSIERICAALRPVAYKKYFSGTTKLYFVLLVLAAGLLSLLMGGISADGDMTMTKTRHCAIITSTSKAYSTFHFSFIILAYGVSFFSLLLVYLISRHVEGTISGRDRNKKISLMMTICGISMILVSLPSIVMIGIRWNIWEVSDLIVAFTYGMPGCLTIANTCINLIFRRDYREALISIFWENGKRSSKISMTPSPSIHSHFNLNHPHPHPHPHQHQNHHIGDFHQIAKAAMTKVDQ